MFESLKDELYRLRSLPRQLKEKENEVEFLKKQLYHATNALKNIANWEPECEKYWKDPEALAIWVLNVLNIKLDE